MYSLKVIVASTRPKRKGIHVANWFVEEAKKYGQFQVEMLDLAKIDLPLLDEPNHPRYQDYTKEHTLEWSRQINEADAFVFVIPEYNHFAPPALINAIDYLFSEWHYKPAGLVSYGGISGGLRSAVTCKQILVNLKIMPVPEAVSLPFFEKRLDGNGQFKSDELVDHAVRNMMGELLKWTGALKPMREKS